MRQHEKVNDQSPAIRLPIQHHRRIKSWAALRGLSIRQAVCLLIDKLTQPSELPEQVRLDPVAQKG